MYICAPANLLVAENYQYLIAICNSRITQYIVSQNAAVRSGGFLEFKPMYVSQIPIINATESQRTAIEKLVQKCLDAKKDDPTANTRELEKQIDNLVYKLYQLTYNEVKIIDPEFELTEQEYLDLP